jgi:hypothetical protein
LLSDKVEKEDILITLRKSCRKAGGFFPMSSAYPQNNIEPLKPVRTLILKYEGEDDGSFFVSGADGVRLAVPKNRNIPKPFIDKPRQPLTPAFRLLALAFVGLAPAGLGTLVLAPLAALWALAMLITRPLSRGDRRRVIVIWGISAGLLGLAIPLSLLFLARLGIKGLP